MNTKFAGTVALLLAVCPLAGYAQPQATAPAAPAVTPPNAAPTVPPAVVAPAAAPVSLRYKFAVGQVHRYSYDMDMSGTMLTGQSGAGIPLNMTMHMVFRQTVKEVRPSDGAATISAQIEDSQMLQNGQAVTLPEAQAAQMKKPYTIVMLPTGKTLSAEMPSLGGASPVPGMDFGKNMFSSTAFLPSGPVKVGDTWTGDASSMGMVQTTFTSVLNSLTQKDGASLATIGQKQTGTIHMTMNKGLPMTMKLAGKVTGKGTQVFDADAGAIQSATGTSSTDMTMTFGKAADGTTPPGMPQSMKMQMQTQFTMTRLSDLPPTVPPVQ